MYKIIEELCKKKGISISSLCKNIDIPRSTLTELKSGRTKFLSSINTNKIANYFGVSVDYLLGKEDKPTGKSLDDDLARFGIKPIKTKKVPLLGKIACGSPIYADEQYGEYITVDEGITADFCLEAKGDSMINARIYDGDIVFCVKQETIENGQIAAVIIDDEATLKRFYYYPDEKKVVLSPENSKFAPIVYIGEELSHIHIIGRAIAFQSFI